METQDQHIRIKAILEILGKPKEFIEKKLEEYIEKIKQDENLMVMGEKISPAQEQGEAWSTYAEIEVVVKGTSNLIGFCIDYMPSSVEVIKPESFSFPERTFTEFMNDLVAKLHTVDMVAKQLGSENRILKENLNRVIKNNILVLLKFKVNKVDGLMKATGIAKEELEVYLKQLVEEKRVKEEENSYYLT